jgi:hypothetical protein
MYFGIILEITKFILIVLTILVASNISIIYNEIHSALFLSFLKTYDKNYDSTLLNKYDSNKQRFTSKQALNNG